MALSRFAALILLAAGALAAGAASPAAAGPNKHNAAPCLLCHKETPRFGIDTRQTVTFRRSWDDPALCATCHKPEENLHPLLVSPGALETRAPRALPLGTSAGFEGRVVCTTCHFIHAADNGQALLRGFAGSQDPGRFPAWRDLCRECHGAGLEKRSPHAGDERACAFCHQGRPTPGGPAPLTRRAVDLCNFCHGGKQDEHFARANPFPGAVGCNDCHDPHLGADHPGRLSGRYREAARESTRIDPHYRKALCFGCHTAGDGYPLRSADSIVLCNRCHGTGDIVGDIHPIRKVPESITPPQDWPLAKGFLSCLTCHTAGHVEDRGRYKFLRGGPYADRNDFCVNCHEPDSFKGRNPHADINRGQGCEFCHASRPVPGKDTIDTVRFIADPNILCLRCHAEKPHPAGLEHTMTVGPERAAEIPGELPVFKGIKIVCATCHNPHIEEVEGHKLRGELGEFGICTLCHRF